VVNIFSGHAEASKRLVAHPDVDHVSFTGSDAVGRSVGQAAIGHFATVTLELGGKSPQIVFDDADLDAATSGIVAGVFAAAGQTCVAGSRIFVHERLYDELLERVRARAAAIRIGDPLDEATELGPLAFSAQLDRVSTYVEGAVDEGATLLAGGRRPDSPSTGLFYEPTILTDVNREMRIAREEVFGPVVAVMSPFSDDAEVVAQANDTHFGLAAGMWTKDVSRAHRIAALLDVGTVWINMYRAVSPVSPTGGFGASGMGKENGMEALLEYTRVKSVWVNTSTAPPPDPFRMRTPSDD
jgi:aldehyde dehydrogenase (NAD+)